MYSSFCHLVIPSDHRKYFSMCLLVCFSRTSTKCVTRRRSTTSSARPSVVTTRFSAPWLNSDQDANHQATESTPRTLLGQLVHLPPPSVGEVWRRKKQGWTVLFYMYLVSLIKFHKVDLWSVKIPQLLHLSPTLPSFKPKHPPKIMARGCNTINQLTISKAEMVHWY